MYMYICKTMSSIDLFICSSCFVNFTAILLCLPRCYIRDHLVNYFGEMKQCKCMFNLIDFPLIALCLGWSYNDLRTSSCLFGGRVFVLAGSTIQSIIPDLYPPCSHHTTPTVIPNNLEYGMVRNGGILDMK